METYTRSFPIFMRFLCSFGSRDCDDNDIYYGAVPAV